MASVAVEKLDPAERDQLAVSYAAFVLSGQGADITADNLAAVLKAANLNVAANLLNAVAKALVGKNVTDFFGSMGGGSAAPASAPAAAKTAAPEPAKQTPPPPPPAEEEEDMDMGDLFGWLIDPLNNSPVISIDCLLSIAPRKNNPTSGNRWPFDRISIRNDLGSRPHQDKGILTPGFCASFFQRIYLNLSWWRGDHRGVQENLEWDEVGVVYAEGGISRQGKGYSVRQ